MAGLAGKRVALLVATGSEETELTVIRQVLVEAGAMPVILSPKKHELRLWMNVDWGNEIPVNAAVAGSQAEDYDALIIPGGLQAADTLRADRQAVQLVRDFINQGKVVAAMGHAVWVLIEAEAVGKRLVTSIESMRSDVINAGGTWIDDPAVMDGHVVTGRHRHDLPDFMAAVAEGLARE